MRVSEIRVNQIRVNQGLGVLPETPLPQRGYRYVQVLFEKVLCLINTKHFAI